MAGEPVCAAETAQPPTLVDLIDEAALFTLDSLTATGALTLDDPYDRMARALFQFDLIQTRWLLPILPDAALRARVAALVLFEDPETPPDGSGEPVAPRGLHPDPALADDPSVALLNRVLTGLETALQVVLGGEPPDVQIEPLSRYLTGRVLLHCFGSVAAFPPALFVRDDLSEGEIYCACRYYLDCGDLDNVDLSIQSLHSRYPRSAHLFHLHHLLARARNAPFLATAHLVNAATLGGCDERLAETVHGLVGRQPAPPASPGPETQSTGDPMAHWVGVDGGLRGLRGLLEPGSFAERRASLRLVTRPDSLCDPCREHTDADLAADSAQALEVLAQAPTAERLESLDRQDPAFRASWGPSGFLFVFPPKSADDIALTLAPISTLALVGHDMMGRLLAQMSKLEPEWDGRLTAAVMVQHGAFLRSMWTMYMERTIGPVLPRAPLIHIVTDLAVLPWVRALWPQAPRLLAVPDHGCLPLLEERGVVLADFERIHAWRQPQDGLRLLKAMGLGSRARRRAFVRRLPAVQGLLYPL